MIARVNDEERSDGPITAGPTIGLFEMALEVADLAVAERFYREVVGLPVVGRWQGNRQAVWFGLGGEAFLGLWPPETGGAVAIHGGRGGAHVHYALRVPRGGLAAVAERLAAHGIEPERIDFGGGNVALYVTDPDGHVLELTERATLWDGAPSPR